MKILAFLEKYWLLITVAVIGGIIICAAPPSVDLRWRHYQYEQQLLQKIDSLHQVQLRMELRQIRELDERVTHILHLDSAYSRQVDLNHQHLATINRLLHEKVKASNDRIDRYSDSDILRWRAANLPAR